MKKRVSLLLCSLGLLSTAQLSAETEFVYDGNPLVRHIYTADPTARVFNDRLYVYTSHDESDADYYTMLDWRVLSTDDMVNWTDHGSFFGLDDIAWADEMAWAPDCVKKGKNYYFYYPVERAQIGVAVSKYPTKGFVDSGKPLIDKADNEELIGPEPIDPSILFHGRDTYLYFGCREPRVVKLNKDMISLKGEIQELEILGNENDKEGYGGFYGEGPFLFEREGLIYMLYSNGWSPTSTLVYATATNPEGPFTYQGEILPNAGCTTSHGSIVEFKGEWYLFYHNQDLSGLAHRRSIGFDKLTFDADGKIETVKQTRADLRKGADIYEGKGRIALSSDGNMHDNDDMQATMMTLMMLARAGVQPQTTLYTYADHIWASEANDLEIMKESAEECGARFGFQDTRFLAAQTNPEAAYEAMKDEILKSTAEDPLFIIAAGPMQVVGEAINRAAQEDMSVLSYVTVLSHSNWNNKHADKPLTEGGAHTKWNEPSHNGWTWSEMVDQFGKRVNFNLISDQNGTGKNPYASKDKFSARKWDSWAWMNEHPDDNVKWVFTKAKSNPAGPDYSDAGLAYYLLADLDGVRGDEFGNPEKLRKWMGDKIVSRPLDKSRVWEINVSPRNFLLSNVGDTQQLTASALPTTAKSSAVKWFSTNPDVVRVDARGVVTAVARGEAKITAISEDGGKIATSDVVVGRVQPGEVHLGNSYIAIEAEASINPIPENWVVMTPDKEGFDSFKTTINPINNTYIEYKGGNITGAGVVGGTDVLTYKFTPKTTGVYRLSARMAQRLTTPEETYRQDLCNDVYVKLEGDYTPGADTPLEMLQSWNKMYGRGCDAWGTLTELDAAHAKFTPAYKLKAGVEYTLSVSGRSQNICLDYFLLTKEPTVIRSHVDLALANEEEYQPKIGIVYKTSHNVVLPSMDFEKFTDMGEGFADASIDYNRGVLQMPHRLEWGAAEMTYEGPTVMGYVVLNTMLEGDGESEYVVYIENEKIRGVTNSSIYGTETPDYTVKANQLTQYRYKLEKGDRIRVEFKSATNGKVPEGDTTATSRGRWHSLEITQ